LSKNNLAVMSLPACFVTVAAASHACIAVGDTAVRS